MAALCKFPCFLSLPPEKDFISHKYPSRRISGICTCSTRKSRKAKSNVELCKEIREFVSAVGLPEGHVPSMKELSNHGRNDLANIVRRRGYKLVRDLLSNATEVQVDELPAVGASLTHGPPHVLTGQGEKVRVMAEDGSFSAEVPSIRNHFVDPEDSYEDSYRAPIDSSANLLHVDEEVLPNVEKHDEEIDFKDVAGCLSMSSLGNAKHDEEDKPLLEEYSLSTSSHYVGPPVKEVSSIVNSNPSSTGSSAFDDQANHSNRHPELISEDGPRTLTESSGDSSVEMAALDDQRVQDDGIALANSTHCSSLEEKVAKFIQSGELGTIEDNVYNIGSESVTEESEGVNQQKNEIPFKSELLTNKNFQHKVGRSEVALMLNGAPLTSKQVTYPREVNHFHRNGHLSVEDVAGADCHQDLDADVVTSKREKQVEINHLKFMLHQKELELSHLKEQIEKEKLALSALQAKAETEIRKAQKLISDKDAELIAAEENLSGLVEVKIQYSGDGKVVEVAGSFNGWRHRIRMDPEPSSTVVDSAGSRKSRRWSTMLWLYPGVYEIKFIVDGQWMVDPQRESMTRGGICNNVLRVER